MTITRKTFVIGHPIVHARSPLIRNFWFNEAGGAVRAVLVALAGRSFSQIQIPSRTVDGLGILLHQAVPGFEDLFGMHPKVTPGLRELVKQSPVPV